MDVRAANGSSLAAGWRLETGDGSVTLEVPETLAADVDLHTGDGHIDLDMPVTTEGNVRAERSARQAEWRRQFADHPHRGWVDSFAERAEAEID